MKVTTLNRFRGLLKEQRRGTSTVSLEMTLETGPHPHVHTTPLLKVAIRIPEAAETCHVRNSPHISRLRGDTAKI